jgi:hypothetical protein
VSENRKLSFTLQAHDSCFAANKSDFTFEITYATAPSNTPAHLVPWVHTCPVSALCQLEQHFFGHKSVYLLSSEQYGVPQGLQRSIWRHSVPAPVIDAGSTGKSASCLASGSSMIAMITELDVLLWYTRLRGAATSASRLRHMLGLHPSRTVQ